MQPQGMILARVWIKILQIKKSLFNKVHILIFFALNITSVNSDPAQSQIIPDKSLGSESVRVNTSGNIIQIGGGANRGITNLQSYTDFNINNGQTANIITSPIISNIIVRVTGLNSSELLGNLSVPGSNKNLFFMNPNGVIFGPNAKILLNGGFTATTAQSIGFNNGYFFQANSPNSAPESNLENPTSLNFNGPSGAIVVQGNGHSITQANNVFSPNNGAGQSLTGLRLSPGTTFTLAGGQIDLNGGLITASNINVASITVGSLKLDSSNIDTTDVSSFGNINLSNQALLDASGMGGGNILLNGNDISFSDGSLAIISNYGVLPAGDISINASGTLNLQGISARNQTPPGKPVISRGLITQTFNGKGANIVISAKNFVADNSTGVITSTFGPALGGNISLTADTAQILGGSPYGAKSLGSLVLATTAGTGNAGTINFSGRELYIDQGGFLISATFGQGDGGDVFVSFTKIKLVGGIPLFDQNTFIPSAIASTSAAGGNGGLLDIRAGELDITGGARVDASALSNGGSGSIKIDANKIDVSGKAPGPLGDQNPSQIISSASQVGPFLANAFRLGPLTAQSGSVDITANNITVQNGGKIATRNDGSGAGGLIEINAQKLFLINNGSIDASTNAGGGGNINLQVPLIFSRDSRITASAEKNGQGGNIYITSDLLAGDYLSEIRANAQQGKGGLVQINTKGLLYNGKITATSENGPNLNGKVIINVSNSILGQRVQFQKSPSLLVSPRICDASNSDNVRFILGSGSANTDDIIDTLSKLKGIPHFRNKDGKSIPYIRAEGFYIDSNKIRHPIAVVPKSSFSPDLIKNICA